MRIEQALDFLHDSKAAQFDSLADLMPMERLIWAIIGMAMFRHVPMTQLVNQLDIFAVRQLNHPGPDTESRHQRKGLP